MKGEPATASSSSSGQYNCSPRKLEQENGSSSCSSWAPQCRWWSSSSWSRWSCLSLPTARRKRTWVISRLRRASRRSLLLLLLRITIPQAREELPRRRRALSVTGMRLLTDYNQDVPVLVRTWGVSDTTLFADIGSITAAVICGYMYGMRCMSIYSKYKKQNNHSEFRIKY